jgi:hypothetical protein
MQMDISGYIKRSYKGIGRTVPRIVCRDGVSLSVQASKYAYCSPRDDSGDWPTFEVSFPSIELPESWREYAGQESMKDGVFGYVPAALVEAFIAEHGGAECLETEAARREAMKPDLVKLREYIEAVRKAIDEPEFSDASISEAASNFSGDVLGLCERAEKWCDEQEAGA